MSHSLDFTAREAGPAPPPTVSGRVTYFTHTLCPYAERVWIALLEKEVPFDLVHIDLSSKPSWFRSINPAGLVPAVRHNAHTVTESLGIIAWVDSEFEGPNLAGNNPKELKEAIYAGSSVASAGLDLLSGKNGRYWGISGGQSTGQKQAMEKALQALFEHQTHPGPFLLGDCISLADIAVYPFIQRFAVITPELCGYQFETACNGKVGEWLEAMRSRPSCTTTTADSKLFNAAAKQHGSLDFFDYVTYGVFDLHPQNSMHLEKTD